MAAAAAAAAPISGGFLLGAAGIGAAASLAGGLLANSASKKAAKKNRQFVERMSNTAYQRAMADMRAAGLNPMLAYKQGGASTPGVSMPSFENVGAGIGNLATTASQAHTAEKTGKSQRSLNQVTQGKISSSTAVDMQSVRKLNAETAQVGTAHELLKLQIPGAMLDAEIANSPEGRAYRYGEAGQKAGYGTGYVGTALQALKQGGFDTIPRKGLRRRPIKNPASSLRTK